jgi:Protein of unknown function (DUF2905)
MRHFLFLLSIVVLGAACLAPAISYMGLDPLPGDFMFNQGNMHLNVPVTYSLCASLGLGLLYYFLKR